MRNRFTSDRGVRRRIKPLALGLAAATITAIAFGICGLLFTLAPNATSAFMSWVLHIDITGMTRPVSTPNLTISDMEEVTHVQPA